MFQIETSRNFEVMFIMLCKDMQSIELAYIADTTAVHFNFHWQEGSPETS
jgi:hypothetical protein